MSLTDRHCRPFNAFYSGCALVLHHTSPTEPCPLAHSTATQVLPGNFLKSIGRSTETKVNVENLDGLRKSNGSELKSKS